MHAFGGIQRASAMSRSSTSPAMCSQINGLSRTRACGYSYSITGSAWRTRILRPVSSSTSRRAHWGGGSPGAALSAGEFPVSAQNDVGLAAADEQFAGRAIEDDGNGDFDKFSRRRAAGKGGSAGVHKRSCIQRQSREAICFGQWKETALLAGAGAGAGVTEPVGSSGAGELPLSVSGLAAPAGGWAWAHWARVTQTCLICSMHSL